MDIYITETKILVLQAAPKEEHAFISKYSKAALNKTIQDFPELEHSCKVYVLIHKGTKEVVRTHDLAQFSEERGLPKPQITQLKYGTRKSAKGWYLVPENEDPEGFLNKKLAKQAYGKQVFARRMFS